MRISSRTPEGSPNRCPICGCAIRIEPSRPLGDAPCPACGTLLWFIADSEEIRIFDPDDRLIDTFAARLGVSADEVRRRGLNDLELDSLDVVELVMELEEQHQ